MCGHESCLAFGEALDADNTNAFHEVHFDHKLELGFLAGLYPRKAWCPMCWNIPTGNSAIAEVYPSLLSRRLANEDRIRDQHDAFSIAAWLSRASQVTFEA